MLFKYTHIKVLFTSSWFWCSYSRRDWIMERLSKCSKQYRCCTFISPRQVKYLWLHYVEPSLLRIFSNACAYHCKISMIWWCLKRIVPSAAVVVIHMLSLVAPARLGLVKWTWLHVTVHAALVPLDIQLLPGWVCSAHWLSSVSISSWSRTCTCCLDWCIVLVAVTLTCVVFKSFVAVTYICTCAT